MKNRKLSLVLFVQILIFLLIPASAFAMDMDMESPLKLSPHLTVLNLTDNTTDTITATINNEPVLVEWSISMQACVDGSMSGVIEINSEGESSDTVTVTALNSGTATVEAKYGEYTAKTMVMVETEEAPVTPEPSEGKLVINPHLTTLDLETKPTATLSAYLQLDDNTTNLVPVDVNWEIVMEASVDGQTTGVIEMTTEGTQPTGSIKINALTAGTATIRATYGDQTNEAMVMVNTPESPMPEEGKLVIQPNLTVLDLNSKPTATVTAYLMSDSQDAYLVPVEAEWDITMEANINGDGSGVVKLDVDGPSTTANLEAMAEGTTTVRAKYNGQEAMAMVMSENITSDEPVVPEVTDITINSERIYLVSDAEIGETTTTLTATLSPEGIEAPVEWSTEYSNLMAVTTNEDYSATVTALEEGYGEITVSAGNITKTVEVIISNKEVVLNEGKITTANPDYFTVEVSALINPALYNPENTSVQQVSMFAWSQKDQSDINAKVATEKDGLFTVTFPINENAKNNYFIDADSIYVNIYGSGILGENGNLITVGKYDWINSENSGDANVAYVSYSQNVGFDTPTIFSGVAGNIDSDNGLEGIRISSTHSDVLISTTVHVEDLGWVETVNDGVYAGTMHQNKQIESVVFNLYGDSANLYNLTYRVYQKDLGWSDWVSAGEEAGVTGQNLELKGIEVQMTTK